MMSFDELLNSIASADSTGSELSEWEREMVAALFWDGLRLEDLPLPAETIERMRTAYSRLLAANPHEALEWCISTLEDKCRHESSDGENAQ